MTGLEMQELPPHLGGDAEQKKLLVEIVQGLLMAHARLDAMDEALRRTVEAASRQHLDAFHVELETVDARFENTASDLARTIGSLSAVREQLLQTVEEASTKHLEAFTGELRQVDARFQETAGQVDGTVQSLQAVRDNLVRSVEASTAQHADAFSQQVGGLQKSIEKVGGLQKSIEYERAQDQQRLQQNVVSLEQLEKTRHAEVLVQAKAHTKQIDNLDLDRRLARLADWQTTQGTWAETQATKQATNWANLNGFLNNLQVSLRTAHTERTTADREMRKKISDDSVAVGARFAEIEKLIEGMDASHLKEMRGVHVRLNWFIVLALAAVAVASIILYRTWLR